VKSVRDHVANSIHPHMLRHTYVTELYRQSKDIRLGAKGAGPRLTFDHDDLHHIVDDDMEAAMRLLNM